MRETSPLSMETTHLFTEGRVGEGDQFTGPVGQRLIFPSKAYVYVAHALWAGLGPPLGQAENCICSPHVAHKWPSPFGSSKYLQVNHKSVLAQWPTDLTPLLHALSALSTLSILKVAVETPTLRKDATP